MISPGLSSYVRTQLVYHCLGSTWFLALRLEIAALTFRFHQTHLHHVTDTIKSPYSLNYVASTTLEAQRTVKNDKINTVWAHQQDQAGMTLLMLIRMLLKHSQWDVKQCGELNKTALDMPGKRESTKWNQGHRSFLHLQHIRSSLVGIWMFVHVSDSIWLTLTKKVPCQPAHKKTYIIRIALGCIYCVMVYIWCEQPK